MFLIFLLGIISFFIDHLFIGLLSNESFQDLVAEFISDDDVQDSVSNFLNFELQENKGLIFGIMENYHRSVVIGVSIVSFIIGFVAIRFVNKDTALGIKLALGGAVSNIYHRINCGYVHDYIQFFFLSLNFSDILIISGIFVIIYYTLNFKSSA